MQLFCYARFHDSNFVKDEKNSLKTNTQLQAQSLYELQHPLTHYDLLSSFEKLVVFMFSNGGEHSVKLLSESLICVDSGDYLLKFSVGDQCLDFDELNSIDIIEALKTLFIDIDTFMKGTDLDTGNKLKNLRLNESDTINSFAKMVRNISTILTEQQLLKSNTSNAGLISLNDMDTFNNKKDAFEDGNEITEYLAEVSIKAIYFDELKVKFRAKGMLKANCYVFEAEIDRNIIQVVVGALAKNSYATFDMKIIYRDREVSKNLNVNILSIDEHLCLNF